MGATTGPSALGGTSTVSVGRTGWPAGMTVLSAPILAGFVMGFVGEFVGEFVGAAVGAFVIGACWTSCQSARSAPRSPVCSSTADSGGSIDPAQAMEGPAASARRLAHDVKVNLILLLGAPLRFLCVKWVCDMCCKNNARSQLSRPR